MVPTVLYASEGWLIQKKEEDKQIIAEIQQTENCGENNKNQETRKDKVTKMV